MKLHGYFRSTAAWRVRIALGWKGLDWESVAVDLLRGDQRGAAFRGRHPQGLVPFLEVDGGGIGQSLAILEYLEETRPAPPLLPADAAGRARVRQLALQVACEIHPLANLRVRRYLAGEIGLSGAAVAVWCRHWLADGLAAFEAELARSPATGRFCHGDAPSFADLCLVPQLYNARRADLALERYPTLLRVERACEALPAFRAARPEAQPDAPPEPGRAPGG